MTRDEIKKAYDVKDGIIRSPGKFEVEPIFAPHFHEFADDGEILSTMTDGCGEFTALVEISDEDRKEFPEIPSTWKYVLVCENDVGFVSINGRLSEEDADQIRAEYEEEE